MHLIHVILADSDTHWKVAIYVTDTVPEIGNKYSVGVY